MGEALQTALTDRYDTLTGSLRERVLTFVLAAFDSLPAYRDTDAAAFLERVLPVVLGVQQQMGQVTDAYLTAMLTDMLGTTTATAPATSAVAEQLRGVPAAQVYERPIVQVRTALSR
ncbi:hypothetical protein ABZ668_22980, partial [Streptomyces parvus]